MMLFDMGVNVHENLTAVETRRAIDEAEEIFDLVMIAERLDESLIFLKELLCWDYKDIIFFTKNARRKELKPSLSVSALQKMRELNSGDVLLYDHFLARHEKAVLRYGEDRMALEVAKLTEMKEALFEHCGTHVVDGIYADAMFKEYSNLVHGYELDNKTDLDCILLSLPELSLVMKLRKDREAAYFKSQREKLNEAKRQFSSEVQSVGQQYNQYYPVETNSSASNISIIPQYDRKRK